MILLENEKKNFKLFVLDLHQFEVIFNLLFQNGGKRGSAQLLQIYSREVGQPYITFVGITLRAVVYALWLMILKHKGYML